MRFCERCEEEFDPEEDESLCEFCFDREIEIAVRSDFVVLNDQALPQGGANKDNDEH